MFGKTQRCVARNERPPVAERPPSKIFAPGHLVRTRGYSEAAGEMEQLVELRERTCRLPDRRETWPLEKLGT